MQAPADGALPEAATCRPAVRRRIYPLIEVTGYGKENDTGCRALSGGDSRFYRFIYENRRRAAALVGLAFQAVMQNRADYGRRWYRVGKREMAVYEALKIKRWKRRMPTYDNALFNPQLHSWEEIAQAMCQAELVHETIVVLSFLPIAGGIWFGAYPVFIITSVLAAGYDLLFVMMQRYNRQRVLMLPAHKSTSPGRTTQTAG